MKSVINKQESEELRFDLIRGAHVLVYVTTINIISIFNLSTYVHAASFEFNIVNVVYQIEWFDFYGFYGILNLFNPNIELNFGLLGLVRFLASESITSSP